MKYRIEVIERHVDMLWVEADNYREAEKKAYELSKCEFFGDYTTDFTGETED